MLLLLTEPYLIIISSLYSVKSAWVKSIRQRNKLKSKHVKNKKRETYIIVGSFKTENECVNLLNYLKTKFTRFLVSQLSFSQDITKDRFSFVPIQNFSESWTDEKLYKIYGLTQKETNFIESMIRPMELDNG